MRSLLRFKILNGFHPGEQEILLKKAKNIILPEKPRLLQQLKDGKFNIPDFVYVSAADFRNEEFEGLIAFLDRHRESFKVITRSAHPKEEYFKGCLLYTSPSPRDS